MTDLDLTEPHDAPPVGTCHLCLGDGVCPNCDGTGNEPDPDELTRLRRKLEVACHAFRSLGRHDLADELEEVGF